MLSSEKINKVILDSHKTHQEVCEVGSFFHIRSLYIVLVNGPGKLLLIVAVCLCGVVVTLACVLARYLTMENHALSS